MDEQADVHGEEGKDGERNRERSERRQQGGQQKERVSLVITHTIARTHAR